MTSIMKPILRPILQPMLRSPLGEGGIGALLANLLTEEGQRITTEESSSIKLEENDG